MHKRILLPADGPRQSDRAVRTAVGRADAPGARHPAAGLIGAMSSPPVARQG